MFYHKFHICNLCGLHALFRWIFDVEIWIISWFFHRICKCHIYVMISVFYFLSVYSLDCGNNRSSILAITMKHFNFRKRFTYVKIHIYNLVCGMECFFKSSIWENDLPQEPHLSHYLIVIKYYAIINQKWKSFKHLVAILPGICNWISFLLL